MKKPLWKPSEDRIKNANITKFIEFINQRHKKSISSYFELYDWSVENIADFWSAMWAFGEIKASQSYDKVIDDPRNFTGAKWFTGARLNFAENLLRYRDDRTAFVFKGETQAPVRLTYAELYHSVARVAKSLRDMGIKQGEMVVGYMPNMMETTIAMLAATSIGATWACCGTELGAQAALDRLGQIEPKVLFTVNGYWYKGKAFDTRPNIQRIVSGIPSLRKVVVVSYTEDKPDISSIPNSVYYKDFQSAEKRAEIKFEQLPFDHPVYVMFSSGTTGKPKCMVQGAGGILINHLKELIIQCDLKREDTIIYMTAPSWMMWNWLQSSLAVGATVVLYDGNPSYPDWGAIWQLAQDEKISVFGTSASYIHYLKSEGAEPGKKYDLSSLREICQTGSPLSAEGFEYVYQAIKKDVHFNSISGGTDINGCFAIGSPTLPVYAGELQSPGLAMKIKAYDENGKSIFDQQGELVCEAPAPSMPIYFWNDPGNEKYRDAYFSVYPKVWRHGDYILRHSDTGGLTFYGRSDAVLKPSGVRIGTAEIYNVVEKLDEVADSLAIGQNWEGDQRIILFVKLAPGHSLTDDLKNKIRKALRDGASPRHVPGLIFDVPDIPYTFSMKKVESSVTNIINGRAVTNRDALNNPDSLDYYEKLLPMVQK